MSLCILLRSHSTLAALSLLFFLNFVGCGIKDVFVNPELASGHVSPAGNDEISVRVFLIGDAGRPSLNPREPALVALQRDASRYPDQSVILFLGDNTYPRGLPAATDPDRYSAEQYLQAQIDVVRESGARGIFVPGNHDWDGMDRNGWESMKRQEQFVASQKYPGLEVLPRRATPGPHTLDIGDELRLIFLDTQWWLHGYDKPSYPDAPSIDGTKEKFIDSLLVALKGGGTRKIIVAAHHPLETHGLHGGFFDWKSHLFPLRDLHEGLWLPLPIVGSVVPAARLLGISRQDLANSHYERMKAAIERTLKMQPPLAYVAGHEHSLQVLQQYSSMYYLISGNGIAGHASPLTHAENTLFASPHVGYMRLDILHDRRVRLGVFTPTNGGGDSEELFSLWLRP